MGSDFLGMLVPLPLALYAAWHASRQPDERWAAIGENKTLWITCMTAGYFVLGLGLLVALYYLAALRGQLERAEIGQPPPIRI